MKPALRLPADQRGWREMSIVGIRGWRVLLFACLGLVAVSWIAWRSIPRRQDPRVEPSEMAVRIPYPGATAADVEAQVVREVEEPLQGIDGVEYVESKSTPGRAEIHLKFRDGTAMDVAAEQVRGAIAQRRANLPAEVEDPLVVKYSTSMVVQMVLAVAGNRSDDVLTDGARRLKQTLAELPGVSAVELRGAAQHVVRVAVDPARLAQHKLSAETVAAALRRANVRVAGGSFDAGPLTMLLRVDHAFTDAPSVARIPVGSVADGHGAERVLALGDIAQVSEGERRGRERFMHEGLPAVGLEVRFSPDADALEVGRRVRATLEDHRAELPTGTDVYVAYDQPEAVEASMAKLVESLLEGIGLVVIVISIGLGLRSSLVVATVLPLALGGAVVGLFGLGFALEHVSIAGLIVALGLVVDDAVVVTESIQLMRERGLGSVRSAVLGTARVFWANNGTTAVACAAFSPLFFMGGDVGTFVKGLPAAVVLALVTSLVVAQLWTPWLAHLLVPRPRRVPRVPDTAPFDPAARPDRLLHRERNPLLRILKAIFSATTPWVVRHPLVVITLATALLAGAVALVPRIGVQFFPKANKPFLFVALDLPHGEDQRVAGDKLAAVIAEIRRDPGVRWTSAVLGAGYPDVFVGRETRGEGTEVADVLVRRSSADTTAAVARRLRASLATIPGVRVRVEELYDGPPVAHPVVIRISGDDYDRLRGYADGVESVLRAQPGVVNVDDGLSATTPTMSVTVDPERASRLGLAPGDVGTALRRLYGQDKITSFLRNTSSVEVILDRPRAREDHTRELEDTLITTTRGAAVPLRAVAEIHPTFSYAQLQRRNGRRIVEVTADVAGTALPDEIVARVDDALRQRHWERGYGYSYGGEREKTEQSFAKLGLAAACALLAIFLLLLSMFHSITLAAIVLGAVPYVLIGVLGGLAATHTPFGFMAFLGLVALTGVYVNHKIYFIDRMRHLMASGHEWQGAVVQGVVDRIRPVVLTALTAVLGLLPLTLGGGPTWAAFGWVNVFGLLASIPLSLVLVPAFVSLAFRLRRPRAHSPLALERDAEDDTVRMDVRGISF